MSTGYFDDQLSVKIAEYGTTTVLYTITAPVAFINAGEKSEVRFTGEFPTGVVGKTYQGYLFIGNQQIPYVVPVSFTIGEHTGIADVEAVMDQPVEYFNLQGMPVAADRLREGQIYIRRQGGKATKIVY